MNSAANQRDRGAAEALGLVIMFPVMLLLAVLVMSIGRNIDSTAQARSAAEAAAQAAALQRSESAGHAAMGDVVNRMLGASTSCVDHESALTWSAPVGGAPGRATVTVSCVRPADGLEMLELADARYTVIAIASIDPLRAISELGSGTRSP